MYVTCARFINVSYTVSGRQYIPPPRARARIKRMVPDTFRESAYFSLSRPRASVARTYLGERYF